MSTNFFFATKEECCTTMFNGGGTGPNVGGACDGVDVCGGDATATNSGSVVEVGLYDEDHKCYSRQWHPDTESSIPQCTNGKSGLDVFSLVMVLSSENEEGEVSFTVVSIFLTYFQCIPTILSGRPQLSSELEQLHHARHHYVLHPQSVL